MKVAVLMSTYNGEEFIREQIDSILAQKDVDVYLYIRDDGSTDDTVKIINEYEQKYSNVLLINRDNRINLGINKGVLEFMLYANRELSDFEYFAYSDQDDKWLDDKMSTAVRLMDECEKKQEIKNQPMLYYCKKTWTDENLNILYDDKKIDSKGNYFDVFMPIPSYGCTFVFNRKLLEKTIVGPPALSPLAYDVYLHRLARAIGVVIADKTSHILHRRHGNNLSGGPKKYSVIKIIKTKLTEKDAYHGIQLYVGEISKLHYNDLGEEQKKLFELVLGYRKSFSKKIKLMFYKEAYNRGIKLAVLWIGRVLLNAI